MGWGVGADEGISGKREVGGVVLVWVGGRSGRW